MEKIRQQKKFTDVVVRVSVLAFGHHPSSSLRLDLQTPNFRDISCSFVRLFVRLSEALAKGGTTDGVASAFSLSLIGGVGHFRA